MHRQAHEVLPALLQALDARGPIWLVGHSDGGSIALLHAAQPDPAKPALDHHPALAGLIVMAPHILVEEVSLRSIEQARLAYVQGGLREKLARHHADPDSAFWGWNQIWLDPAFAPWSIEGELSRIAVPVLAIQGLNDEYGTLEQIRGIARRAAASPGLGSRAAICRLVRTLSPTAANYRGHEASSTIHRTRVL
jgi:pimeloyl-ACP methyl ester carboxylesterase